MVRVRAGCTGPERHGRPRLKRDGGGAAATDAVGAGSELPLSHRGWRRSSDHRCGWSRAPLRSDRFLARAAAPGQFATAFCGRDGGSGQAPFRRRLRLSPLGDGITSRSRCWTWKANRSWKIIRFPTPSRIDLSVRRGPGLNESSVKRLTRCGGCRGRRLPHRCAVRDRVDSKPRGNGVRLLIG